MLVRGDLFKILRAEMLSYRGGKRMFRRGSETLLEKSRRRGDGRFSLSSLRRCLRLVSVRCQRIITGKCNAIDVGIAARSAAN